MITLNETDNFKYMLDIESTFSVHDIEENLQIQEVIYSGIHFFMLMITGRPNLQVSLI